MHDAKRVSFGDRLEERARGILATRDAPDVINDSPVMLGVEREIALALEHMERTRALHQELRRNLLRHECYLSTEILQREPRGHQVYHDYRLPERDRLRDRLRELERERRHLAMVEEDQMRGLRDRLLVLLNRSAMLS